MAQMLDTERKLFKTRFGYSALRPVMDGTVLNELPMQAIATHVIDPSTEARASGGECIKTSLHFFDRNVFLVRRNRPCAAEWIEDAPFP